MKKILYFSEFDLSEYNSVRDILYNLVYHSELSDFTHEILKIQGSSLQPLDITCIEGITTYATGNYRISELIKDRNHSFLERLRSIYKRLLLEIYAKVGSPNKFIEKAQIEYLRRVVKKAKPDLVVFLIYDSIPDYVNICIKYNIPYVSVLYDTIIERPYINKEKTYADEEYVIEHSAGYFIPDIFFNGYLKQYNSNKIKEYRLPLLIEEQDVLKGYANSKHVDFSYFGQIQPFRGGTEINEMLSKLGITLDVYTTQEDINGSSFRVHPAISKDELYSIVAGSRYVVAIDNGRPYEQYLPSKSYLYVSFTKPVIAFGNNHDSALIRFFKDYPWFYYQRIDESLDGLNEFLKTEPLRHFDKKVHDNYLQYLPQSALKPIVEVIRNVLN